MGSSQSAEPVAPKPDAKVQVPDAAPVETAMDFDTTATSNVFDTIESLNTQTLITFGES